MVPDISVDAGSASGGSRYGSAGGVASPLGRTDAVDRRKTIQGIVTYLVLTLVTSAIIWHILIQGGTLRAGGGLWTLALMWCPGVSGLVTRLLYQRTLRGVGWRWAPQRYEWAGYWIPIAYAALVYLPLWAAGYADFSSTSTTLGHLAARLHLSAVSGAASGSAAATVIYILITGTVGMIPNSIAALGEELGWRGFLVPELAKVTSFTNVALISGVVWASWHVPLIIGADYRGAGPVWYSVVCFVVMVVGMGFLFAWLRLRSGSVWPVMLLHASHNLWVQAIFDPLTRHAPVTDYMIGEFGAGLAIVLAVIGFVLWQRGRTQPPVPVM